MHIIVREYTEGDLPALIRIWNRVVDDGIAFPQEDQLTLDSGTAFFAEQTHTAVAVDMDTDNVVGLYILHPNNIGRCGHIANASYAVDAGLRGQHIGEQLVLDCIEQARRHGFRLIQFNAVVAENIRARHLYERLGFRSLGTIPDGFRLIDGRYADICLYYREV